MMNPYRTPIRNTLLKFTAWAIFLLLSLGLSAQVTVSGKVTSVDDQLGLPGATVLVKGALTGTVTDFTPQAFAIFGLESKFLFGNFAGYAQVYPNE